MNNGSIGSHTGQSSSLWSWRSANTTYMSAGDNVYTGRYISRAAQAGSIKFLLEQNYVQSPILMAGVWRGLDSGICNFIKLDY